MSGTRRCSRGAARTGARDWPGSSGAAAAAGSAIVRASPVVRRRPRSAQGPRLSRTARTARTVLDLRGGCRPIDTCGEDPRRSTLRRMPRSVRTLLVVLAAVAVWLVATPASASAPLCDSRGASGLAPPPTLDLQNASVDVGMSPDACPDGVERDRELPPGPRPRSAPPRPPWRASSPSIRAHHGRPLRRMESSHQPRAGRHRQARRPRPAWKRPPRG